MDPRRKLCRVLVGRGGFTSDSSSSPLDESPPKMADPFQVRVRFSAQLQNLNASVTSAQKAAQYALKYKDMDEDLHSCILEQLEKVSKPLTGTAR